MERVTVVDVAVVRRKQAPTPTCDSRARSAYGLAHIKVDHITRLKTTFVNMQAHQAAQIHHMYYWHTL